jgi:phage repressor protein C with HTH and peptisase S24 domain
MVASTTVNNGSNAMNAGDSLSSIRRKKVIDSATRELIDRLLLERISLAGIARATQVSEQWLQTYVNEKYAQVPRQIQVAPKKGETNDAMR